jgi:CRISPR-associated endonuclease Csn1
MTNDGTPSALSEAGYLRPDQRVVNQKDSLPPPPVITNPLVRQALHQVRKVVNAVLREHGKPARIHIEMAREVKGTALDRARRSSQMRKRERARDEAAKEIRTAGIQVTREAIDRYLLWEEQRHECVYSGRCISVAQLFGGEVEMDHILPRERSLDNSLMNRVLCFRSENADKKDRTPYEWLAAAHPDRYEAVLQRTKRLPYPKAQRFRQQTVTLEDFFARQFVDTTYITTQVREYVRCLGVDVLCSKGSHTHELRKHWGLNSILHADGLDLKNREDHRHHAVDAIVIAATNRSRLQELARLFRLGGAEQTGEVLSDPWPNFRADVEQVINAINVSHRVQRNIRGALHEETLYGPTSKSADKAQGPRPWAQGWVEEEHIYVRRKPVTQLTSTKHLAKVRDATIRSILRAHIQAHGIDPDEDRAIPSTVWKDIPRMPSGVPIRKVRLLEESETFREIRPGSFVKPGSNHHIVYRRPADDPTASWIAEVVTTWDAAQRVRRGKQPVDRSDRPGQAFLMSLMIGESFLIEDQGMTRLCVVRKLDQRSKRVHYKLHHDARQAAEIDQANLYASPPRMKQLRGRKATVDPLGRIRWAND